MSANNPVSLKSRFQSIFYESAKVTPAAMLSVILFTTTSLLISFINYYTSDGSSFANAYSIAVIAIGQISVIYITQNSIINGASPSIKETLQAGRFWLYFFAALLIGFLIVAFNILAYSSVLNGWGSFFNMMGIKPEAFGFPHVQDSAVFVSTITTLFLAKKFAFVLPEIVSGNKFSLITSWKMMKVGGIKFWFTTIIALAPLFALAVGYREIQTNNLTVAIITQIMTYLLVTMHAIVFSAVGAIFWKETVSNGK